MDGICRGLVPTYDFANAVDGYVSKIITEDYQARGAVWRKGILTIVCQPLTAPVRLIEAEDEVKGLRGELKQVNERADTAVAERMAAKRTASRLQLIAAASLALNAVLVASMALRRLAIV